MSNVCLLVVADICGSATPRSVNGGSPMTVLQALLDHRPAIEAFAADPDEALLVV